MDLMWTASVIVLLKYVTQLECGTFNGTWQYANVFYSIKYGVICTFQIIRNTESRIPYFIISGKL